jgi:hypothetical protein
LGEFFSDAVFSFDLVVMLVSWLSSVLLSTTV